MSQIRVEVTQDDIDKGVRQDCKHCPIAVALKRSGYRYVAVDGEDAFVGKSELHPDCWTSLPQIAVRFIYEFDKGGKPAPISFDLDLEFS